MKFHKDTMVFGDLSYRGESPKEDEEVQTFINQVRKKYPELIVMHIKNEGKKTKAQADFDKSMGMIQGASDIIVCGKPTLFIEMKQKNHTKSQWKPNQEAFLHRATKSGCMACVCLGWEAGMEAVEKWKALT